MMLPKNIMLTLSMCTIAAFSSNVGDEVARAGAKNAVNSVLSERLPGMPLEPATNCVIDNASAGEILSLAADAATGVDAETARLVFEIAARRESIRCLTTEGIAPFLL